MSIASYRPVAAVTAKDQAGGKPIPAFAFEPTRTTLAKLADHRLLYRNRTAGFQLLGARNAEGPLAPIVAPLRLLFALRASDPGAVARYKPAGDAAAGPSLYFTNVAADGKAQASPSLTRGDAAGAEDSVRIVGRRFRASVPLPAADRPTSIALLRRYEGTRVGAAVPVPPGDAPVAELSLDVSGEEGAAFTLIAEPGGPRQHFLCEDELAGGRAFGVVELVLKAFPGPEPAAGRDFVAVFKRRETAEHA
ncbi:MAG TPA: hypothetical protein VF577_01625 [Allosphingosinicella sp.]|jgi:hypothetical protein